MRLIDVDKIIITRQEYVGALTLKERLRRLLESQPTVEAIPIEWIKSKKIEYEHDRYDYVRGCFDGFNDCIDYLINEWEKENEPQSRNN